MSVPWLVETAHYARTSGRAIKNPLRKSSRIVYRNSKIGEARELTDQEEQNVSAIRAAALVEVIITYGTMCANGNHGEQVFHDIRLGLEQEFHSKVFVLAREDTTTYNCISVHVNNVLVFGCQGRRPTVAQLCEEVNRALSGSRPRLIPYSEATVCDYNGCIRKHKYYI